MKSGGGGRVDKVETERERERREGKEEKGDGGRRRQDD